MRSMNTGSSRLRRGLQTGFTILLIIAVIVLGMMALQSGTYQKNAHDLFVQRLQTECNTAVSLCASLSTTAGSSSSSTLASIRQHIYGMQTINDLNVGLEGANGWLVTENTFVEVYNILTAFEKQIITGMTTTENVTQLRNALSALDAYVQALT